MNAPRDPDFDDLLSGSEDLMARYRALPKAEPARELDIAILAKAREAVARPKPNRLRWMVPLTSVATLALAAGLGWRVYQSEHRPPSAPAGHAAKSDEQIVEFELLDLPNRDAERKEMANSPPPPPPPPPSAPAVMAPPAQPAPVAPADSVKEDSVADAVLTTRQAVNESESPRAVARDYAEPHLRSDHSALSAPPESDKRKAEVSAGLSAAGARTASPAAANELAKSLPAAPEVLEPDEWIQKIRDLQVRRRFNEVRKELAEFRKTYPNYTLPDDLAKQSR